MDAQPIHGVDVGVDVHCSAPVISAQRFSFNNVNTWSKIFWDFVGWEGFWYMCIVCQFRKQDILIFHQVL